MSTPAKRNVIWICVDGFRVDGLNSCGCDRNPRGYFDELFETGAFFDECITSAMHTIGSAHSFMSSLHPSITRTYTQTLNCLLDTHPQTIYLADILRHNGYATFRWDDMATYSCQPKCGFEHYEGGDWSLRETKDNSFDGPRRQAFAQRFRSLPGPKFAYLHLDYLHEYGGQSAKVWDSGKYLHYQLVVADEVRTLLAQLGHTEDDILIINTDHGITLDKDWWKAEREEGCLFPEARIRTFAFFGGTGIPRVRPEEMVRSLDLAPTLLDLLGIGEMKALGQSLVPRMRGEVCEPLVALVEWTKATEHRHVAGGQCPDARNNVCLRTREWKYIVDQGGSAQLIPLNGELCGASAEQFETARRYFAEAYRRMVAEAPTAPDHVYDTTGQSLRRAGILPEVSVLLPVESCTSSLRDALLTIRCQTPDLEILVLDGDVSGRTRELLAEYDEDPRIIRIELSGKSLSEMLNAGMNACRAPHVALVSPLYRYAETYLGDMLKALKSSGSACFAYANAFEFFHDPRNGDYRYVGPSTFYIKCSHEEGGSGVVRNIGGFSRQRLSQHNYIGECALFSRELALEAGGFASGCDPVWESWKRMAELTTFHHVRCPYIIAHGPLVRPILGFRQQQPQCAVTLVAHVDDYSRTTLAWVVSLMVCAEQVGLTVDLALCGPDGVVQPLANAIPGLRYVCTAENALPHRLNAAVQGARGRHLMHLFPGDLPDGSALRLLSQTLDDEPEAPAVLASLRTHGADGSHVILPAVPLECRDLWLTRHTLSGIMYRTSMHAEIGYFDTHCGDKAEWDFLLRLLEYASFAARPEALLATRRPPATESADGPETRLMFRQSISRMNGYIDLVLLNRDLFSSIDSAAGILGVIGSCKQELVEHPMRARLKAMLVTLEQAKYDPTAQFQGSLFEESIKMLHQAVSPMRSCHSSCQPEPPPMDQASP